MSVTRPPMGIGEGFGISLEATYGTAAATAPESWWRPISNTLKRTDPGLPLSGPTGYSVPTTSSGRIFRGTPDISGTVVLEAEYDFIGLLLQNAVGVPSYAVDTPVASSYTHTFSLAATHPSTMPLSFTAARVIEDGGDGGNNSVRFTGVMINRMSISGAGGRIVTVSCDMIAQGGASSVQDDTIGSVSGAPFIEFHDSVFRADFGGAGQTLNSSDDQTAGAEAIDWTWEIDNALRIQQAAGSGVREIRPPVYSGYRMSTLTVNRDFFDDNFFDLYHASSPLNTFGTFGVYCSSDEFITGSTPYALEIILHAGRITSPSPPGYDGGPEIVGENVVIEAGYDGTNAPVEINLVNGTTNSEAGDYYNGD